LDNGDRVGMRCSGVAHCCHCPRRATAQLSEEAEVNNRGADIEQYLGGKSIVGRGSRRKGQLAGRLPLLNKYV